MDKKFIIGLREHRFFGWLASAYWVEKENKEFFSIVERISGLHLKEKISSFSETEQKLITVIDSYNESEITKLFSKKKQPSRDFIGGLKEGSIKTAIREYIERRLVKVVDLLLGSDIPLYINTDSKNVYKEDKIALQAGYAEAVFNFIKEKEGSKYFLSLSDGQTEINLYNKHAQIITNSPCRLLLENKLYRFKPEPEGIDGKKILPFIVKQHINIPKTAEKKYFETFVFKSIEKYTVSAKGFEIIRLPVIPKPVLIFEKDWKDQFNMILKFDYNGNLVSPDYKKGRFVKAFLDRDKYKYEQIDRLPEYEKEKVNFLHSIGMVNKSGYNFKIKKLDDNQHNETVLIEWLNKYGSVLTENGFDIRQKFFNKKYLLEKAWIDFTVDDKNDWFDVRATVNFGSFSFPFTRLAKHIKNLNNEFVLPTGEIAIIPEEWFAKYKDFILFSKPEGDVFNLGKFHFSVLSNDFEDIDADLVKKMKSITHQEFNLPKTVKAKLRPYQKHGFDWINSLFDNNFGACLADDMGLGKTLQTLAVISRIISLKQTENTNKSHVKQLSLFDAPQTKTVVVHDEPHTGKRSGLIVMPTSLIHNWENEIKKFTPEIKAHAYTGTRRDKNTDNFSKYDVILTSYGIVRNDIDILLGYDFRFMFLDESQAIKNPLSKTYKSVLKIVADYKMVLTGTPIENSLTDLWAQMNFINPGLLGSLSFFKEEFVDPIEKYHDAIIMEERQDKLKKIIGPFFLRRKKEEVAGDLPDLTETIHYCTMPEEQSRLYETEKSKIRNVLLDAFGKKKSITEKNMLVIQALTKLRLIANHTKLLEGLGDFPSGKFDEVIRMIESLRAENHKVLIFSSFVKHLDLFADYFKEQKWKYAMLTGKTTKREQVIEQFQTDEENILFLISLKAGGSGLNLTAADYVFIIDPWWNPASEKQAIARAHRIGQDKKVMAYRFITENSIEEKILKFQAKKQELADVFINNNPFSKLSEHDILEIFD